MRKGAGRGAVKKEGEGGEEESTEGLILRMREEFDKEMQDALEGQKGRIMALLDDIDVMDKENDSLKKVLEQKLGVKAPEGFKQKEALQAEIRKLERLVDNGNDKIVKLQETVKAQHRANGDLMSQIEKMEPATAKSSKLRTAPSEISAMATGLRQKTLAKLDDDFQRAEQTLDRWRLRNGLGKKANTENFERISKDLGESQGRPVAKIAKGVMTGPELIVSLVKEATAGKEVADPKQRIWELEQMLKAKEAEAEQQKKKLEKQEGELKRKERELRKAVGGKYNGESPVSIRSSVRGDSESEEEGEHSRRKSGAGGGSDDEKPPAGKKKKRTPRISYGDFPEIEGDHTEVHGGGVPPGPTMTPEERQSAQVEKLKKLDVLGRLMKSNLFRIDNYQQTAQHGGRVLRYKSRDHFLDQLHQISIFRRFQKRVAKCGADVVTTMEASARSVIAIALYKWMREAGIQGGGQQQGSSREMSGDSPGVRFIGDPSGGMVSEVFFRNAMADPAMSEVLTQLQTRARMAGSKQQGGAQGLGISGVSMGSPTPRGGAGGAGDGSMVPVIFGNYEGAAVQGAEMVEMMKRRGVDVGHMSLLSSTQPARGSLFGQLRSLAQASGAATEPPTPAGPRSESPSRMGTASVGGVGGQRGSVGMGSGDSPHAFLRRPSRAGLALSENLDPRGVQGQSPQRRKSRVYESTGVMAGQPGGRGSVASIGAQTSFASRLLGIPTRAVGSQTSRSDGDALAHQAASRRQSFMQEGGMGESGSGGSAQPLLGPPAGSFVGGSGFNPVGGGFRRPSTVHGAGAPASSSGSGSVPGPSSGDAPAITPRGPHVSSSSTESPVLLSPEGGGPRVPAGGRRVSIVAPADPMGGRGPGPSSHIGEPMGGQKGSSLIPWPLWIGNKTTEQQAILQWILDREISSIEKSGGVPLGGRRGSVMSESSLRRDSMFSDLGRRLSFADLDFDEDGEEREIMFVSPEDLQAYMQVQATVSGYNQALANARRQVATPQTQHIHHAGDPGGLMVRGQAASRSHTPSMAERRASVRIAPPPSYGELDWNLSIQGTGEKSSGQAVSTAAASRRASIAMNQDPAARRQSRVQGSGSPTSQPHTAPAFPSHPQSASSGDRRKSQINAGLMAEAEASKNQPLPPAPQNNQQDSQVTSPRRNEGTAQSQGPGGFSPTGGFKFTGQFTGQPAGSPPQPAPIKDLTDSSAQTDPLPTPEISQQPPMNIPSTMKQVLPSTSPKSSPKASRRTASPLPPASPSEHKEIQVELNEPAKPISSSPQASSRTLRRPPSSSLGTQTDGAQTPAPPPREPIKPQEAIAALDPRTKALLRFALSLLPPAGQIPPPDLPPPEAFKPPTALNLPKGGPVDARKFSMVSDIDLDDVRKTAASVISHPSRFKNLNKHLDDIEASLPAPSVPSPPKGRIVITPMEQAASRAQTAQGDGVSLQPDLSSIIGPQGEHFPQGGTHSADAPGGAHGGASSSQQRQVLHPQSETRGGMIQANSQAQAQALAESRSGHAAETEDRWQNILHAQGSPTGPRRNLPPQLQSHSHLQQQPQPLVGGAGPDGGSASMPSGPSALGGLSQTQLLQSSHVSPEQTRGVDDTLYGRPQQPPFSAQKSGWAPAASSGWAPATSAAPSASAGPAGPSGAPEENPLWRGTAIMQAVGLLGASLGGPAEAPSGPLGGGPGPQEMASKGLDSSGPAVRFNPNTQRETAAGGPNSNATEDLTKRLQSLPESLQQQQQQQQQQSQRLTPQQQLQRSGFRPVSPAGDAGRGAEVAKRGQTPTPSLQGKVQSQANETDPPPKQASRKKSGLLAEGSSVVGLKTQQRFRVIGGGSKDQAGGEGGHRRAVDDVAEVRRRKRKEERDAQRRSSILAVDGASPTAAGGTGVDRPSHHHADVRRSISGSESERVDKDTVYQPKVSMQGGGFSRAAAAATIRAQRKEEDLSRSEGVVLPVTQPGKSASSSGLFPTQPSSSALRTSGTKLRSRDSQARAAVAQSHYPPPVDPTHYAPYASSQYREDQMRRSRQQRLQAERTHQRGAADLQEIARKVRQARLRKDAAALKELTENLAPSVLQSRRLQTGSADKQAASFIKEVRHVTDTVRALLVRGTSSKTLHSHADELEDVMREVEIEEETSAAERRGRSRKQRRRRRKRAQRAAKAAMKHHSTEEDTEMETTSDPNNISAKTPNLSVTAVSLRPWIEGQKNRSTSHGKLANEYNAQIWHPDTLTEKDPFPKPSPPKYSRIRPSEEDALAQLCSVLFSLAKGEPIPSDLEDIERPMKRLESPVRRYRQRLRTRFRTDRIMRSRAGGFHRPRTSARQEARERRGGETDREWSSTDEEEMIDRGGHRRTKKENRIMAAGRLASERTLIPDSARDRPGPMAGLLSDSDVEEGGVAERTQDNLMPRHAPLPSFLRTTPKDVFLLSKKASPPPNQQNSRAANAPIATRPLEVCATPKPCLPPLSREDRRIAQEALWKKDRDPDTANVDTQTALVTSDAESLLPPERQESSPHPPPQDLLNQTEQATKEKAPNARKTSTNLNVPSYGDLLRRTAPADKHLGFPLRSPPPNSGDSSLFATATAKQHLIDNTRFASTGGSAWPNVSGTRSRFIVDKSKRRVRMDLIQAALQAHQEQQQQQSQPAQHHSSSEDETVGHRSRVATRATFAPNSKGASRMRTGEKEKKKLGGGSTSQSLRNLTTSCCPPLTEAGSGGGGSKGGTKKGFNPMIELDKERSEQLAVERARRLGGARKAGTASLKLIGMGPERES
uniref:Uncharacterized protein n=1 Tax=Chromera velia CCMP2878 TaxID=1169474 RepID=A0A0G4IBR0_9ALVE|eukprot:Cvel_12861.t1-p1 / transcript=Cvel_12861.t1 / gene=Cvel_12861 / organism=Chromera_velia_CCMP2878 / gene_product=hypothetical protein / transcript_product=hypothetical protein / location=Cvel_scaffold858:23015-35234(-) / protein_length=2764 / sequence_SO=supercontig / SO=protein_coding / is_pseudo=false